MEGSPSRFRSILPHEPFPVESPGYLQIQGSLEPRQGKADSGEKVPLDPPHCWPSIEDIRRHLLEALGTSRKDAIGIPHGAVGVDVLGTSRPVTKAVVLYQSSRHAFEVVEAVKAARLTPDQVFRDVSLPPNFVFSSQQLHATPLTTKARLENSWPRASPPKFRRLLTRIGDSPLTVAEERQATRFVFVSGLFSTESLESYAHQPWTSIRKLADAIRSWANEYDSSGFQVEVFIPSKKSTRTCHLGMRSPSDAQRIIEKCQGSTVQWRIDDQCFQSASLFLDYAAVTNRSLARSQAREQGDYGKMPGEPSRPECTSTTDEVVVPGLVIVPNYISEEQERSLMAVLNGPQAPWAPLQSNKSQTGAVKRKVQHYGYVFSYETADVVRDRTSIDGGCPPMPSVDKEVHGESIDQSIEEFVRNGDGWKVLAAIIEKTKRYDFMAHNNGGEDTAELVQSSKLAFPAINQMTVNHYKPGEGIGSHVDTKSAFGDGLISISLNSGIVMEFRCSSQKKLRKLVYLPARSCVVMSGPARYDWEHMIVSRRTDTVSGVVQERQLRVSLTLRTALSVDGAPLPLVQSNNFPLSWSGQDGSNGPESISRTPATERNHVHAVYDAIATQWHHTRGKRGVLWPGATRFLAELPRGSVVADIGCGDGKYFPAVWRGGSFVVGIDMSFQLLLHSIGSKDNQTTNRQVSSDKRHFQDRPTVAVGDCMSVPLRDSFADAVICIAVMHHLSTESRRIQCIRELVRIVRPGGTINIQAWAMEQQLGSRRKFAVPDVFVPFNAQPKYLNKSKSISPERSLTTEISNQSTEVKSIAQVYSEEYGDTDFDARKGLVVFQRYCHMYRPGELERLASEVEGVELLESGYESGNYYVILKRNECSSLEEAIEAT